MAVHTSTIATVRTAVRQRMDLVNSPFVTDAELFSWITAALAELHDLLVGADNTYLISTTSISLNGSASYSLPTDFYKARKADFVLGSGMVLEVPQVTLDTKDSLLNPYRSTQMQLYGCPGGFYILGSTIYFVPQQATGTVTLYYYPSAPQPALDTDTFDVLNGFDEYLVADCCLRIAMKRNDEPGPWFKVKADMQKRVESMGKTRNMAGSWGMAIYPRGSGF
jgi:hypothetical protein